MAARQLIDLPAVFATLPYGLWDTIQTPSPDGMHWQQGVTWPERCPTGDTTYDECLSVTGTGAPPEPAAKTANVEQTNRGATPFTVYARFDCSPVGLGDAQTAAQDALARVEQQQVETALWTGAAGGQPVVFPHLAADTEVLDGNLVLQTVASPVGTAAAAAPAPGARRGEPPRSPRRSPVHDGREPDRGWRRLHRQRPRRRGAGRGHNVDLRHRRRVGLPVRRVRLPGPRLPEPLREHAADAG